MKDPIKPSQSLPCSQCFEKPAFSGRGDNGDHCWDCLIKYFPEELQSIEDALTEEIRLTMRSGAIALLQSGIFGISISMLIMWPLGAHVATIFALVMALIILCVNAAFWSMTPVTVRVCEQTIWTTVNGVKRSCPLSSVTWREGSTLSGWFALLLPMRKAIILTRRGKLLERCGNYALAVGLSEYRYHLWKRYLLELDVPQSDFLGREKRAAGSG